MQCYGATQKSSSSEKGLGPSASRKFWVLAGCGGWGVFTTAQSFGFRFQSLWSGFGLAVSRAASFVCVCVCVFVCTPYTVPTLPTQSC